MASRVSDKWAAANQLYTRYIIGESVHDLAEAYNMTPGQVKRAIEYARVRANVGASDGLKEDASEAIRSRLKMLHAKLEKAMQLGLVTTRAVVLTDAAGQPVMDESTGQPKTRTIYREQADTPEAYLPIFKLIDELETKQLKLAGLWEEGKQTMLPLALIPLVAPEQRLALGQSVKQALSDGEDVPHALKHLAEPSTEVLDADFSVVGDDDDDGE